MSVAQLADDSPVDPDDELLVAYLDGELDTRSRSELENRLLENEKLRRRLQHLQASWEWLEDLPNATPSEKLVETTLEFVVADLNSGSKTKPTFWSRNRWAVSIVAICVAAMVTVAATISVARHANYKRELSDLVLAENLQAYVHGSNMKLMRQLSANNDWNQAIQSAAKVGELYLGPTTKIDEVSLDQRATAVLNLSVDERQRLERSWEQFTSIDEETQRKLRLRAAAVAAQPDSGTLLETMRVYAAWRETLPTQIRDDITSDDLDARDKAIKDAIAFTMEDSSRRSGTLLDDETVERIYFALGEILKQRVADIVSEHPEAAEFFNERLATPDGERGSLWFMLSSDSFSRDGRRSPRDSGRSDSGRSDSDMRRPLSPREQDMIECILTTSAIKDLEKLSSANVDLKTATLTAWAEEAVRRKSLASRGELPSLLERYQGLDTEMRERLDLRPPEEMLDRLLPEERRPYSRRPGPPMR